MPHVLLTCGIWKTKQTNKKQNTKETSWIQRADWWLPEGREAEGWANPGCEINQSQGCDAQHGDGRPWYCLCICKVSRKQIVQVLITRKLFFVTLYDHRWHINIKSPSPHVVPLNYYNILYQLYFHLKQTYTRSL